MELSIYREQEITHFLIVGYRIIPVRIEFPVRVDIDQLYQQGKDAFYPAKTRFYTLLDGDVGDRSRELGCLMYLVDRNSYLYLTPGDVRRLCLMPADFEGVKNLFEEKFIAIGLRPDGRELVKFSYPEHPYNHFSYEAGKLDFKFKLKTEHTEGVFWNPFAILKLINILPPRLSSVDTISLFWSLFNVVDCQSNNMAFPINLEQKAITTLDRLSSVERQLKILNTLVDGGFIPGWGKGGQSPQA